MPKRDDMMHSISHKLPKLTAALAQIIDDAYVPEETWRALDKGLTQQLLRGAAAGSRPLGTNRYQSIGKKQYPK